MLAHNGSRCYGYCCRSAGVVGFKDVLGDAAAFGNLVAGLDSPSPDLGELVAAAAFAATAGRLAGAGAGAADPAAGVDVPIEGLAKLGGVGLGEVDPKAAPSRPNCTVSAASDLPSMSSISWTLVWVAMTQLCRRRLQNRRKTRLLGAS